MQSSVPPNKSNRNQKSTKIRDDIAVTSSNFKQRERARAARERYLNGQTSKVIYVRARPVISKSAFSVSLSIAGMCHGRKRQFQHAWNVSRPKTSVSACLECVVVAIVSFSMDGMCHCQKRQFQHGWTVSRPKTSVSACLECVVVEIVCFRIAGMCWGQKRQFQHSWNESGSKKRQFQHV